MTERVQVIVEAKDAASGVLRGITEQMGSLGHATQELTAGSINWANVAQQTYRVVSDVVKDAVDVSTKYAASVRDVALASGTTAENASRLIQVLDDYEITAEGITAATRKMTSQGLAPTIETIAMLSDKYLALNTAQERNAFIQENLGRGGAKWANVLKEGSDAILAMNEGVSEGLILDDELIKQYEEMRLNQDQFNDNVMALKITLVNELVPAINDVISAYQQFSQNQEDLAEVTGSAYTAHRMAMSGYKVITAETMKANEMNAASFWEQSYAVKASAKATSEAVTETSKLNTLARSLNDATKEQIKLAGYTELEKKMKESGGEITEEEAQSLQQVGLELGIFDQSAVNAANSVDSLSSAMAAGTITAWEYANALNSIPTQITTTLSSGITQTTYTNTYTGGTLTGDSGFARDTSRESNREPSTSANNFYGNTTFMVGNDGVDFMEVR